MLSFKHVNADDIGPDGFLTVYEADTATDSFGDVVELPMNRRQILAKDHPQLFADLRAAIAGTKDAYIAKRIADKEAVALPVEAIKDPK